jgi:threonine/homoserine/homoserine lactone efflux protein
MEALVDNASIQYLFTFSFYGGFIMDLSAPKQVTFWISVVLAVLGLLGHLVKIPFISTYAFWFLLVGFILLAAGCFVKDL